MGIRSAQQDSQRILLPLPVPLQARYPLQVEIMAKRRQQLFWDLACLLIQC